MSAFILNEGMDVREDRIEEQFKELSTRGLPLEPRDPASEKFLARLDGSIAQGLDASGMKFINGRLIISINETEIDQGSSLNMAELYSECIKAQETFFQTFVESKMGRGSVAQETEQLLRAETLKSFADVQVTIDTTLRYLQKKTIKGEEAGRFDRALRAFKEQAPNIKCFLNVLPSGGEYTSVICGGLSILIQSIENYGNIDSAMCQGLEDIQSAMVDDKYATEIHPDDPEIHRCLSRVCAAIFGILGCILKWICKSRRRKFIGLMRKPATYGEELGELVSRLRLMKARLLQRAAILSEQRDRETAKITKGNKKYMEVQTFLLYNVYKSLASQHEQLGYLQRQQELQAAKSDRQLLESRPTKFDVDKVLAKLGYDSGLLETDCNDILRRTPLDRGEKDKVIALTNDVRLQAFVEVGSSAALLLQGGGSEIPRSAVSHVTAAMIEALSQACGPNKGIHVLAHFCGEHRDKQKTYSSPLDLIVFLILQLIAQCRQIDSRVLAAANIVESCQDTNVSVKDLCNLLGGIMKALPDETILFCIIDGINFFECPLRRDDMRVIVSFLLQQARERRQGAKVKVLFTTPARCHRLIDLFESYEIYTLRRNLHSTTETLFLSGSRGRGSFHDSIAALSDSEAM